MVLAVKNYHIFRQGGDGIKALSIPQQAAKIHLHGDGGSHGRNRAGLLGSGHASTLGLDLHLSCS